MLCVQVPASRGLACVWFEQSTHVLSEAESPQMAIGEEGGGGNGDGGGRWCVSPATNAVAWAASSTANAPKCTATVRIAAEEKDWRMQRRLGSWHYNSLVRPDDRGLRVRS